jgi:glycosyltransferase involved in cell wall biosynthesis
LFQGVLDGGQCRTGHQKTNYGAAALDCKKQASRGAEAETGTLFPEVTPDNGYTMTRQVTQIAVTGLRGFPNVQGGIETHCEQLYPRLTGKRCAVTVFTRKPYMAAGATMHKGVRLLALPSPTNKFLETIVHTFRCVIRARQMSHDLLHIHGIGPSLFTPLARAIGLTVVVTTHGPDYERAKWKGPAKIFLRFCERMGMTFAHEVIAIADNIADDVKQKYARKATVIPNGVEIPAQLESTQALQQFGLERAKYILAIGRFVPEKGFHDLIDAFGEAGLDGWKLVIVGRADHEDEYSLRLKALAKKNSCVVLTGFQKGTPLEELYSHAGLFVIPSYYEGLPIVLLEALSYGLQCIASDIPANKNVDLNDDNFFQTGQIDKLAAKLIAFSRRQISTDDKAAQLAMIQKDYNWDAIAGETFKIYNKALSARSLDKK